MGAVAMNVQSLEQRDISAGVRGEGISWQAPAGEWRVMIFTCLRTGGTVDCLCP